MRAIVIGGGICGRATVSVLEPAGMEVGIYDLDPRRRNVDMEWASTCDSAFICLGTGNVAVDSDLVKACALDLHARMSAGGLIVQRSTCLPGTADVIAEKFQDLVYAVWPEFLREMHWQEDAVNPLRHVWGGPSPDKQMARVLSRAGVYSMSRREAEVVKLAANAALFLRMTLWHALGKEATHIVQRAVVADYRLESFDVEYGHRVGGKCLPKDLEALSTAVPSSLWDAMAQINGLFDVQSAMPGEGGV